MDKEAKIKAQEWIKKARHDIEAVEIILNNSGPADVAGVLLQQGIEKYLKGYLIGHGWKLLKVHDLKQLLDQAVFYDKKWDDYYDLLDRITEFYFEEKYPFGEIEATLEEIKDNLEKSKEIIKLVEDFLREGK